MRLHPALLWLWRRPAATTPNGPLAWEPPYAAGSALEKTGEKKNPKKWLQLYFPDEETKGKVITELA